MNPFIAFCLYVSARVFVQYLKSKPEDAQTVDSLRFLISAMNALKRRNPLTESFLVQLDVDFEALAAKIPKLRGAFPRPNDSVSFPFPSSISTPLSLLFLKAREERGFYRDCLTNSDCSLLKHPRDFLYELELFATTQRASRASWPTETNATS